MKQWIFVLTCLVLFGCANIGGKIEQDKAIKFTDTHIQKIINENFTAAYLDYYPDLRSSISFEQFKDVHENQLEKKWGKLKNAEFKSISFGKRITLGKIFNIATLWYKAEVNKPNTFIKIELIKKDGIFFILGYYYINFVGNKIPREFL